MKPALIELPMPITTDRLLLREPRAGDGAELNAAICESFEELKTWMPWAKSKPTLEESEENVRVASSQWLLREDLRIPFFDRTSGKMIGSSGLHRIFWDVPCFEIGYWVRTQYQSKGYVTEATNAITRYAFQQLGAKRVEIRCDATNTRSFAVAERLGFELEGRLRSNALSPLGELRDTLVFARLDLRGLPDLKVSWPR